MIAITLPLLLLLLSLPLLVLGWRGRVVGSQPVCRKCGFDLTGRPVTSTGCPECGSDLRNPRATRSGHRFRRRGMLWAGAILLLLGITSGGVIGTKAARGTNFNPYKPLRMLVSEVSGGDASVSNAAVAEIVRRIKGGRLSEAQVRSVAEKALAAQADHNRTWLTGWGDLVETARANGKLSDEAWMRYVRQAPSLSLEVRPVQDRSSKRLPYFIVLGPARVGSGKSPLFATQLDPRKQVVSVNEQDLPPQPGGLAGRATGQTAVTTSKFMQSVQVGPLLAKMADGAQTLRVKGTLELFDTLTPSGNAPLTSTTFDLTANWTLQPATGDARFNRDPTHRKTVEAALSVKHASLSDMGNGNGLLSAIIEAGPLPVSLAYQIFARQDGREWKIGQFSARAGPQSHSFVINGQITAFSGDTLDLVFRPSLDVASNSTDTFAIWDGQVVIKDVKVRDPAAPR